MSTSQKSILQLLEDSGVGFANAKTNGTIKEKVGAYGYNESRLDELLKLNAGLVEYYYRVP